MFILWSMKRLVTLLISYFSSIVNLAHFSPNLYDFSYGNYRIYDCLMFNALKQWQDVLMYKLWRSQIIWIIKNKITGKGWGNHGIILIHFDITANGWGDMGSILGRVIPKILKMVLDTSCLTLSNIRYVSRVKWSNPGKEVAPSHTSRCRSYWKGSLLVALE